MFKQIIFAAAVAALLAGCGKHEPTESEIREAQLKSFDQEYEARKRTHVRTIAEIQADQERENAAETKAKSKGTP